MSYEKSLIQDANKMDIQLSGVQASKLITYLQLMLKWGNTYNLSAIKTMSEGITKHLLDSLSILPYIQEKPLLDIGSGAGLPGIIISIMKPNISVTVLDSVGKKCRFMQFAKTQFKFKNLNIVNTRIEHYQPSDCFSQIVSRAFAKVDKTLKFTQHLLCDNGQYLLMKGSNVSQEVLPYNAKIHRLVVPGITDMRFLIQI